MFAYVHARYSLFCCKGNMGKVIKVLNSKMNTFFIIKIR